MDRDRRRSPALRVESLEGKLLLAATPRSIRGEARPAPLILDGTFTVDPAEAIKTVLRQAGDPGSPPAPTVSTSLPFSGRARSMGAVSGSIDETTANPSRALLKGEIVLTNAKGSVRLRFDEGSKVSAKSTAKASTTVARYTVASGDGAYAGAKGAGNWTTVVHRNLRMTIKLHSTAS